MLNQKTELLVAIKVFNQIKNRINVLLKDYPEYKHLLESNKIFKEEGMTSYIPDSVDEKRDIEQPEKVGPKYKEHEEKQDPIKFEKGGEGSGNFDHAGRINKVGGSQPKGRLNPQEYDISSYSIKEFDSEIAKELKRIYGDEKISLDTIDSSWDSDNVIKMNNNLIKHISPTQDYFDARTYHKFEEVMSKFLEYGSNYDKCSAQDFQERMLYLSDLLSYQEERSWERQLSDHGVRHIWSNTTRVLDILESMKEIGYFNVTDEDLYLSVLCMLVHDIGYTSRIARESISGTRLHKKLSAKILEDKKADFLKIISSEQFDKLKEYVLHHDDTTIDWENAPVKTAISLSDNLSLYQEDKLPALFRFVDNGINILKSMVDHKKSDDLVAFENDKKEIFKSIDDTMLSPYIKIKLKRAAREIGSFTPDRILPILVGEVNDLKFVSDGFLKVKVSRNEFQQKLLSLIDIGQDQIMKLAKDYGVSDDDLVSSQIPIYKNGKKVLEILIE